MLLDIVLFVCLVVLGVSLYMTKRAAMLEGLMTKKLGDYTILEFLNAQLIALLAVFWAGGAAVLVYRLLHEVF